jgi:predicted regulator of Ras-like GTPase activity (Roadblock/LC7/MglB family)
VSTYKAAELNKTIKDLSEGIPGIEAIVLETYEGLVLASTLPTSAEEEIIAAISSAAQSVINRAVKELKKGDVQNTLVLSSTGQIYLTDIEGKALLTVIAKRDSNLGLISVMSRRVAKDVRDLLPF